MVQVRSGRFAYGSTERWGRQLLYRVVAAAGLALIAASDVTEAFAQVLPDTPANRRRGVVGCMQSGGAITCPGAPSGGGGGGSYGGYNAFNLGMSLMDSFMKGVERGMEQARQQRLAYARAMNQQGVAQFNSGNYYNALASFQTALQYAPGDATIIGNLRAAEQKVAALRAEAERRQRAQMQAAKDRINAMLGGLAGEFNQRSAELTEAVDLSFVAPAGTSFFGLGGGPGATPVLGPGGLQFIGPGESLFSRGTKYSAPVDLRDSASDQLAAAAPIGKDAAPAPLESGGGLKFIAPDEKMVPPTPKAAKETYVATVKAPPLPKVAPPAQPETILEPKAPVGAEFLPPSAVRRLSDQATPERIRREPTCQDLATEAAGLWGATRRAVLADDIYKRYGPDNAAGAPDLTGFRRISDNKEETRKLFPGMNDQSIQSLLEPGDSDYRAAIYRDRTDPKKVFLVFRGTQTLQDWLDGNIPQGLGVGSQYYAKAIALAKVMKKSADTQGLEMEIIGHSLGGGMASAAGAANRIRTTTFNPAGVHPNTLPKGADISTAKQYVTYYVVRGEPLNWLQDRRRPIVAGAAGAAVVAAPSIAAMEATRAMTDPSWTPRTPAGDSRAKALLDFKHDLPPAIGNRVTLTVNPQDTGLVEPHLMGSVRHAIADRLNAVKRERAAKGCKD
jgi:dienelactone hydrolase